MKRARLRILSLMAVANRPLNGLEIAQITRTGAGRLYPTLRDLEAEGVLTSAWGSPWDGGPRLRYYEWADR